MRDENDIKIQGRLTKDPEIKRFDSGKTLAKLSIAYNHTGEKVSYFDVTFWDYDMEWKKGDKVSIEGYLQQERWTDKDGRNQSKIVIVANGKPMEHKEVPKSKKLTNAKAENFDEDIPF